MALAQKTTPTPTSAGTSPSTRAPAPSADDDLQDDLENQANEVAENMPEPIFCVSVVKKVKGKDQWAYLTHDYPAEKPPLTKGVIANPYTISGKRSWGVCAEANESKNDSEVSFVLHAHIARGETASVESKCQWRSKAKSKNASRSVNVEVGGTQGIEFVNFSNAKIRYTAHWPTKTQPDTMGEFCQAYAMSMNNKSFDAENIKRLELK